MKKKFLIVLVNLMIQFSFGQTLSFDIVKSDHKKIVWNTDKRLEWEDFKGKPTISNKRIAAMTSTEFIVQTKTNNKNKKVEVLIENIFVCDESWVRNENKNVVGLLDHEQGHFDLNEVHARKLRKKIKPNIGISQVEKLIEEAYQLSNKSQDLYDQETNHGIDKVNQKKWMIRISMDLKDLKKYNQ